MDPSAEKLPDKLYYSIREVAAHTGVEPHVLRYWESEFPSLKPKRSRSGSRSYRKKDVEEVLLIRSLLHEQGYRIDGARKHLLEMRRSGRLKPQKPQMAIPFTKMDPSEKMKQIRGTLREIHGLLKEMGDVDG